MTIWLAIIGVLGTLGGGWGSQLIAAKRELAREKQKIDSAREDHWRDQRLAAYTEFMITLDKFMVATNGISGMLERLKTHDVRSEIRAEIEKISQLREEAGVKMAAMEIRGTMPVLNAASVALSRLVSLRPKTQDYFLAIADKNSTSETVNQAEQEFNQEHDLFNKSRYEVAKEIRKELLLNEE
ncbi:hypothetical protein ACIOD2_46470 [Amycolatopsis sp. NPDC088138]|uniref:hypothetical protein n=1 Tax=Amycolatopsis sp. NPDC088138 TaxID=3363938 RepID=UPI0037F5B4D8